MHPLLRFALAACPADYRREYREAICADIRSRGVNVAGAALDVFCQGVAMRGENLTRDVVVGARSLQKAPLFVTIAIVTIALAIGANVPSASIARGVLLHPLPYPHPDRLLFIGATYRGQRSTNIDYPDVRDFAERNHTFSAISVAAPMSGTLTGMGPPTVLNGGSVGAAYFKVLGIEPELGRLLDQRDLSTSNIVVSDAFWRTKLHADPRVLGRRLTIDDRARTIVGVATAKSLNPAPGYMQGSDYWECIDPRQSSITWRGYWAFEAIGRLRDGVSPGAAQADLSRIASELQKQYPTFDQGRGAYEESMIASVLGPYRDVLLMLYAAALLLLLVAATNIANLLLARVTSRDHELNVREAVGATRARIVAQIATETAMVTALAVVIGVVLGWLALRAIGSFVLPAVYAPGSAMMLPGWDHAKIDGVVIAYVIGLAAFFTIAVSVMPVLVRHENGRVRGGRIRKVLVITEIVIASALLAVSGLWLRSFFAMMHTPTGFAEAHGFAVGIGALPSDRYRTASSVLQFTQRAELKLAALPDVRGAATASVVGLNQTSSTNYSLTQTADKVPGGMSRDVEFNSVSPNFFSVVDIPMLLGRSFSAQDTAHSEPVAIVSRRFAVREFGSAAAALGRRVSVGESSGGGFPLRRIVGVVGDVRHSLSSLPSAEVYVPAAQVTLFQELVLRTDGRDARLANEIDGVIAGIDPLLPPPSIVSFATMRALDAAPTRVAATVFLILAGVALLLSFAGIYGVVAYSVSRRTREFGIRMALGATRAGITASVMQRTFFEAAIGIAAGLALAVLTGRALGDNLYRTAPSDPLTLAVSALVLLGASTFAALVPALRATSENPAAALHIE